MIGACPKARGEEDGTAFACRADDLQGQRHAERHPSRASTEKTSPQKGIPTISMPSPPGLFDVGMHDARDPSLSELGDANVTPLKRHRDIGRVMIESA